MGVLLLDTTARAFLPRQPKRVVDLDRGVLTAWPGDYDNYLRRKSEQIETESRHNARFDKKLSEEEVWIRKGIKARRTRNEGRVRDLQALRQQRRKRIDRTGSAKMKLEQAEKSGKIVFDTDCATLSFGDNKIVDSLTLRIMRGDRVGLIGPNGAGKSTLIKLLLGELDPDAGTVTRGTRLEVAYFDQQRAQLDTSRSVMDNVADGSQTITIGDRKQHVAGYLGKFLFPSERLNSPVSSLSGGERNRLLLARLFARPANLLVMDEPTNDLDVDTLELLEELVSEFEGTVLLVSHDRVFLDNVVTSTLVFDGTGKIREHVGGYTDWLHYKSQIASDKRRKRSPVKPSPGKQKVAERVPARKLSFKEKKELERLPAKIESLEDEQARLHETVNETGFYQKPREETEAVLARLDEIDASLATHYARWESLEGLRAKIEKDAAG